MLKIDSPSKEIPDEIPCSYQEHLVALLVQSFNSIGSQQFKQALTSLLSVEKILKSVNGHQELLITTLHNIAFCFQRLGLFRDTVIYLERALSVSLQSPMKSLCQKLIRYRYQTQVHLQLCAVYSELEEHILALNNARDAVKNTKNIAEISLVICKKFLMQNAKISNSARIKKQGQYPLLQSPHYQNFYKLIKFAMPALKYMKAFSGRHSKMHVQEDLPALKALTIGDIMTIHPITVEEIKGSLEQEFSSHSVVLKVLMTVLAYFSLSIEIQCLSKSSPYKFSVKEARNMHLKAVKLIKLLPFKNKITEQVKGLFKKQTSRITESAYLRKNDASTKSLSRASVRTPEFMIRSKKNKVFGRNIVN